MPGDVQQPGEQGPHPIWVDIGRALRRRYDRYLHLPMPEQLIALLARLDARDQQGVSSGSAGATEA
jgi:Anti-sigma factor NepR